MAPELEEKNTITRANPNAYLPEAALIYSPQTIEKKRGFRAEVGRGGDLDMKFRS